MYSAKGKFGWYELMTSDTAAAAAFYGTVVGWGTRDVGSPEMPYTTFLVGEAGVAGMLKTPPDAEAMGAKPMWVGYISVPDVDAHIEKIVEAGGKLCKPAMDVPGMLRFAVMTDPQGVVIVPFTSNPAMAAPANPPVSPAPGTVGWHELYTTELEPAWDFYSSQFGWTKLSDMDMGPMGAYRIFAEDGETQAGGMMAKMPEMPMPSWAFYFNVDSVTSAVERVKASGGTVLREPMEVPGGQWIIQGLDPQGAAFSLVSPGE